MVYRTSPFSTANPVFEVTLYFDAECLGGGKVRGARW